MSGRTRTRGTQTSCLHCERKASRRGLCNACYQAFLRSKDQHDEDQLIRDGKILPRFAKARSAFARAIQETPQ